MNLLKLDEKRNSVLLQKLGRNRNLTKQIDHEESNDNILIFFTRIFYSEKYVFSTLSGNYNLYKTIPYH